MSKKYKVEIVNNYEDFCDIRITAPSGKWRIERFERDDYGWDYTLERDFEDFSRFILACDKWDYKWRRKLAEVRRKGVIYLDPEHYVEYCGE